MNNKIKNNEDMENAPSSLLFIFVGIYFLGGACYSVYTKKWFPGFPTQLDIFSIFGIYAEVGIALILSAIFLILGILVIKKNINSLHISKGVIEEPNKEK